jgi:hypothetical protein
MVDILCPDQTPGKNFSLKPEALCGYSTEFTDIGLSDVLVIVSTNLSMLHFIHYYTALQDNKIVLNNAWSIKTKI